MSLATVTTLGYSVSGGLQAGPYTLPTLGYGIGEASETKQFCVKAKQIYTPGVVQGEVFTPGVVQGQAGCC